MKPADVGWWFRVMTARALQSLGGAGLLGVALLLLASIWWGLAWRAHQVPLPPVEGMASQTAVAELPSAAVAPGIKLPARGELPLLMTQIQQAAVGNGLAWIAADYKFQGANETTPASLEVRCSLKGSYPRIRATLVQLLHKVPGLTIHELAISRPNSDIAEVDAKLTLAVFMQDDAVPALAAAPTGRTP